MKKILLIGFIALFLISCEQQTNEIQKDAVLMKLSTHEQYEQDTSNDIKKKLRHHDELQKLLVVNEGKDIVVAFDVPHKHRFSLAKIEQELKQQLDSDYPHRKITISTDEKILLELGELEKDIHERNIDNQELKKRLQKIIQLTTDEAKRKDLHEQI